MDLVSLVGGAAGGAGVVGLGGLALYAVSVLRRLERRVAELESVAQPVADQAAPDILAQAQAEARNRQLAILAAVDLADFVSQNYDGASREIIRRIAPHLLNDKVG
jgi:D-arabinose 1-dehydrogenase-like Zn-dependent alcohol dehydrogenase